MSHGARRLAPLGTWPLELTGDVRAALGAHVPTGDRETRALARILVALDTLPCPLDERAGPEHVTGSAVVVGPRGTLLHMHKRLHRWLQPGGHLLEGEGPSEAARRESEEETGLELAHPVPGPRLIHVDVHDAANGHTHFDLRYLLLAPDRDPAPPPGESPEARWFGWEEAGAVADDALVGALQAARLQPEVEGPGHAGAVVARSDAVGKDGAPRHNGGETGRRGVDGTT